MSTFQDFGAIGDGVTDDTVAVQAALTNGGLITDDGSSYLISAPLTANTGTQIRGVKQRTKIIASSAFPTGADLLTIKPLNQTFLENRGYSLENLTFEAQPGSGHRNNVALDTSIAVTYIADFHMSGCFFRDAGGSGFDLALIPSPTDPGNFFCSTIEENFFEHGIKLDLSGDSLNILRNIFTGSTPNPGVWINQVPGASNCVIQNNNFTASGGAIYAQGCTNLRIIDNQIEQALPYNGPATGNMKGAVIVAGINVNGAWQKAMLPIIRGNNINTHGANVTACIALVATDKAIIRENLLTGTEMITNGLDIGTIKSDNY